MSSCYESIKFAKTGEAIPCYSDGKPSASIYNPQREAEQFLQLVSAGFTVVVGYASGLHIQKIMQAYPDNKLLVIEKNEHTIDFLHSCNDIFIPNDIILCTATEVREVLLRSYFPPLDGNFTLVPVRSWVDANAKTFEDIKNCITLTLQEISSDISTQAHFGKIWHRNILQNLLLCESTKSSQLLDLSSTTFPIHKKAFIAGAGPGLELHIKDIKTKRNDYFVIATDTAYHSLCEHEIVSDVVISVDAQHISYSHFMSMKNRSTIFAFDLCANSTAAKYLVKNGFTVGYFKSGHPLCTYIDSWYEKNYSNYFFPTIPSSGGTVTLAALNLAKLTGFTDICTGGCDFAYYDGKMYAKGVYMDSIFNAISNKIKPTENNCAALMFRSNLIEIGGKKTTELLKIYKKAFDDFFNKSILKCSNMQTKSFTPLYKNNAFPTKKFLFEYCLSLTKLLESDTETGENNVVITLLPYFSWFTNMNSMPINKKEIYKIALNATIHG